MTSRHCATLTGILTTALLSIPTASQAIVFGSDVHVGDNVINNSDRNLSNLETLLRQVPDDDTLILAGDQVRHSDDASYKQDDYRQLEETVARGTSDWNMGEGIVTLYSKGNHDVGYNDPNGYSPTFNFDKESSSLPGAKLFAISPDDYNKPEEFLADLTAWLQAQHDNGGHGTTSIIVSHFPLHAVRQGVDETATAEIFDLINYWTNPAEVPDPLHLIFVWGHTHSGSYDNGISMIAKPGETMLPPDATKSNVQHANVTKTLNFLYLNAGYVGTDDGGHLTQLSIFGDYFYYVSRIGRDGEEESALIPR